jgi:crotonobetainyl-CoA:carnitine CoA-transferase CaiB-like acyl-CoA transferase
MLAPYTVLDFTDERGEIGPMLLGDMGAQVIRVELPSGSDARRCPPFNTAAPEDLRSLQFVAFNRNKKSIVLDPADTEDLDVLQNLLARADFVFESAPGGTLETYGYTFNDIRKQNPRVIHTRVSAFGDGSPYADMVGNDLVIAALGGPVSLQGVPDRAPVRLSVPQVWRHAGAEAAAGALVAHKRMLASGEGQYVDVSAQAALTWTMLNAMDAHAIQGFDFERGSSGVAGISIVHPTEDGYIVAAPLSNVLVACLPWMIEDGIADESLTGIDWDQYDMSIADPDAKPLSIVQGTVLLRQFFARHKKQELFEHGMTHGVTMAPVNTLTELLDLEHLNTRDYWRQVDLPGKPAVRLAGTWYKPSIAAPVVRQDAPALNAHSEEIRDQLKSTDDRQWPDPAGGSELPFSGLKVADFAWVGVGPISSKYLADHGAEVVRVESASRPDVLRGNGPFKDAEPGIDRSQFFGDFNTSKMSLSLDMKRPEAIEIARKLIARSDVMIESFAPGAISRLGLGYNEVKELNPGLIMISTCLMGQTGPIAAMAGYGYHAGAMAGYYEVTGWPDLAPSGPWVAYTDTIAPRFISALLAAALDHRRRTGEGCYIDVAQMETGLHFLHPELLDLQVNGVESSRIGNRSVYAGPQGCYPCAGEDEWCAIAVDTDAQWQALCGEMDRSDWADDDRLATNPGRLEHHDELDEVISAWTRDQDPRSLMNRLQQAGVPAGQVQRSSDLLKDPQYDAREFYRRFDHPEMGNIPYAGHQYRISGYNNGPRFAAPALGQHSFEVLSEMLGLTDEEIGSAFAEGIVA